MWRHVFRNRWIALGWSALICWQVYDFVKPADASPPSIDAATEACLQQAGDDLAAIARCSEVARRVHG